MIKDIYDTNLTSVWTSGSIPSEFFLFFYYLFYFIFNMEYLFIYIFFYLSKKKKTPYFLAFVFFFFFPPNDIVLVDEISHGINVKLEIWWGALESKNFGWVGLKQRTWNDGM